MTENITIGIVTGILTTAILFLAGRLFHDSFLPWYRQYMYHGINIAGTWYCYSALSQKIILELKQSCQYLSGKAIGVNEKNNIHNDRDPMRVFDVTGEIKDGFVQLTLKSKDKQRLGISSMLLKVSGDGAELSGVSSGYNPSFGHIESHAKNFYRNETLARKDRSEREEELEHQLIEMQEALKPSADNDSKS